jgi:uncharacterized glyoxalase superfamily protein PhnB
MALVANMRKHKPDGWPSVIPRIVVADPEGLVRFINQVFGCRGEYHVERPAEIRIGDSLIMVSAGSGARASASAFLYVYVENVDETYRRALANRAESLEKPVDTPYGDRRAMVQDRWGNLWHIATRLDAG